MDLRPEGGCRRNAMSRNVGAVKELQCMIREFVWSRPSKSRSIIVEEVDGAFVYLKRLPEKVFRLA